MRRRSTREANDQNPARLVVTLRCSLVSVLKSTVRTVNVTMLVTRADTECHEKAVADFDSGLGEDAASKPASVKVGQGERIA